LAHPGDVLENSATRERIVFHDTAESTNAALLRYEMHFRPRGIVTRQHIHPRQEERHELLAGELCLWVEGRERRLRPGDVVVVPAGVRHRLRSDELVTVLFELRPALRSEFLLETFARLARPGKLDRLGLPSPLLLAVLFREYEDEGHLARPALPVQRAAARALAPVGRLLGYRAEPDG